MKILVTGANGYLGQGVVKALLDNKHTVVATDINVENIDDKYKSQIEKLYNNDSLKKYNSHISDPVKSEFNTTEFLNNK